MTEYMEGKFTLDIEQAMIEFDPYLEFYGIEDFNIEEELYQEAQETTKKTIWQRLGAIIKKAWKAILRYMKIIINGINKLFAIGYATPMTMTQAAIKVTGKTINAVKKLYDLGTSDNEPLGTLNDPVLNNAAKSAVHKKDYGSPLLLEFEEGGKITFNIMTQGIRNVFTKGKNLHTAGYKKLAECIGIVFNCIHHPESVDGLIKIMKELNDTHNVTMNINQAKKVINNFWIQAPGFKFTCTLEEWEATYKKCSELGELLITSWDDPKVHTTQNGNEMDQAWIDVFNNIAQISSFINYGLTLISDTFKHMYDLDPSFYDYCRDIDTLGNFIEVCVNSAIPGKYIYKGCKQFCNIDMCHTMKDASGKENVTVKDTDYSHVGGYGRFVMFPKDTSTVIKCAYNIYGLRSNKIEENIYHETEDVPEVHKMLCGIRQMTKNSYVMLLDRCVPTPVNLGWATKVRDRLNDLLQKAGKNFRLHDINQNGFGKVGDNWVIVDYGQMRRIPTAK